MEPHWTNTTTTTTTSNSSIIGAFLTTHDPNTLADTWAHHLDWSDKQRRILTAGGLADSWYHPDRGFPYDETDLPHYHLLQELQELEGGNNNMFSRHDTRDTCAANDPDDAEDDDTTTTRLDVSRTDACPSPASPIPIVGAWSRSLFYGGWEFTTAADERTFNFQTATVFVDLRVPTTRDHVLAGMTHLSTASGPQLRAFARQHVFAGTTVGEQVADTPNRWGYATRYHAMDWNFVGVPRSRPNRWWIELREGVTPEPPSSSAGGDSWREWAYATDPAGQHYYMEQWDRRYTGPFRILVLRRRPNPQHEDGILIVIGNEFVYCVSERWSVLQQQLRATTPSYVSLTELVDAAVAEGDLETAREWLGSMRGGHGVVHDASKDNDTYHSWTMDCAMDVWNEGRSLLHPGDVTIQGSDWKDAVVDWKGGEWSVCECVGFQDLEELKQLFLCRSLRRRGPGAPDVMERNSPS